MSVRHVAFTMYPVTDVPRAVAFYRDKLGLKSGEVANEYWTEFEVDGTTFGVGNFPQCGTPGSAQSLCLEVADAAALSSELGSAGHEVTDPHQLPMCRIASVKDPDGNTVWLHQTMRG